jgi:hypothetical protein
MLLSFIVRVYVWFLKFQYYMNIEASPYSEIVTTAFRHAAQPSILCTKGKAENIR